MKRRSVMETKRKENVKIEATLNASNYIEHKSHSKRLLLASFVLFIVDGLISISIFLLLLFLSSFYTERKNKCAKIKYAEEKCVRRELYAVHNFITRGPLWLFTIYICEAAAVVFIWLFLSGEGMAGRLLDKEPINLQRTQLSLLLRWISKTFFWLLGFSTYLHLAS